MAKSSSSPKALLIRNLICAHRNEMQPRAIKEMEMMISLFPQYSESL